MSQNKEKKRRRRRMKALLSNYDFEGAPYPTPGQLQTWTESKQVQFLTSEAFQDVLDYEDWCESLVKDEVDIKHGAFQEDGTVNYNFWDKTKKYESSESGLDNWAGSKVASVTTGGGYKKGGASSATGNGTKKGGVVGYTTHVKQCPAHMGLDIVFKRGNDKFMKQVAGAQGSQVAVDSELMLVVDLAGMFHAPTKDKGIFKFTTDKELDLPRASGSWISRMLGLEKYVYKPDVLRIQWDDMGVPPLPFTFWKELWSLLPNGRTVICCMGGHGRTGTALAALLMAADSTVGADKARDLIHRKHCENAIESSSQERYLQDLEIERQLWMADGS
jgi:hypothetical protein